jgi:hypothetical protein
MMILDLRGIYALSVFVHLLLPFPVPSACSSFRFQLLLLLAAPSVSGVECYCGDHGCYIARSQDCLPFIDES